MKEFELLVNEIFEFTQEHAIKDIKVDLFSKSKIWHKEEERQFIIKVHTGFKEAQTLVLKSLLEFENQYKTLNLNLKAFRRERKKEKIKEVQNEIKVLEHKEILLRTFMDFIAWQLLGGQYYRVRRFFNSTSKNNNRPTLSTSNIESIIKEVNKIHDENPINIALMSDLTSFIDIGDILLKTETEIIAIEVKEGKKNNEVMKFIDELSKGTYNVCPLSNVDNLDMKFIKQTKRVLNQFQRGNKLTNFFKDDSGKDPFSNLYVNVNKDTYYIDSYIDIIIDLFKNMNKKNWEYTIYDNIISIGLYQKECIPMADHLIPMLNNHSYGKAFPTFNYMNKLLVDISEPIFYQGFNKDDLFDLFFGRKKLIISLNLDNFIKSCNKKGLNARYMTKKETSRHKTKYGKIDIFEFESKGIIINEKVIIGGGLIGRMVFDFTTPDSIISTIKKDLDIK